MGIIYKLKPNIIEYIVSQKQKSPNLSCRKLADLAQAKFNVKVSKSSVNSIIKQEGLSSAVGRRTKQLLNLQGEIERGGFSILQAVDRHFDISKIAAELFLKVEPSLPSAILKDVEAVVQALTLFKSLFDVTIESKRCYENSEIWNLVGRRPTKSIYNRIMKTILDSQLTVNELVTEISKQSMPISGTRFILKDNSAFFVDGQLQSIWRAPIRQAGLFTTYYKSSSYIEKLIKGEQLLSVFHLQGATVYLPEILNFVSALNGRNPDKTIKQIEHLDRNSNVVEAEVVDHSQPRLFFLGFWPWQLENISDFERKKAMAKLSWRGLETEYYYQIEEGPLSQPADTQYVKYNVIVFKNKPVGAARMGLLTNIPKYNIPKYLSINNLYHWIDPENEYKEFTKKTREIQIEDQDSQAVPLESLKVSDRENNLENIFLTLSQIVFHLFQQRFVHKDCATWSQLKLKDVFLRQKATTKKIKEFTYHNILVSNRLCKEEYIDFICRRLNSIYIFNRGSDFFRFKYTQKSS